MREMFPHYGFPLKIVSDRGTQWNSDLFKALCRRAGVELSAAFHIHPQTNGLVERINEVVEAALRHYISADMSDWDDILQLVELAMNSSHYEDIRSTPFRMNRINPIIKLPVNPYDVLQHSSQQSSTETTGYQAYHLLRTVNVLMFKLMKNINELAVVNMLLNLA
jgi:hypothetical protein